MAYVKTVWKNGEAPALNADNLNKIENELESQDTDISDLKSAFNDFADTVYPANIYDRSEAVNGCRLQSNGATYETDEYFTSGFIDVSFVGNSTLFFATGTYALNKYGVAFYDANKSLLSYSSSVSNSIANNTSAKYMRFSAETRYYPADQLVHVSYGSVRAPSYTAYFKPYLSIETDSLSEFIKKNSNEYTVLFGYSNAGSTYPIINILSSNTSVYVDGYVAVVSIRTGEVTNIRTYNDTPTTFNIPNNNSLVVDLSDLTLKVIGNSSFTDSYIPLICIASTGVIFAGKWLPYINWQALWRTFKEPIIPYSPRKVITQQSSYAADQSMCVLGNWLICFDAQESDGLVHILDKNTKAQIKLMTHTLGHANLLSYCEETDALLISGSVSYILPNASVFIDNESNTSISTSDCVAYSNSVGVFGESPNVSYCPVQGTADTLSNYSLKKYQLTMSGNSYTGSYTELKEYKGNYRMPVMQDLKFYNGFLYQGVGYGKASVYKLELDNTYNMYKIIESYDVPNDSIYELEGVSVDGENVLITTRLTSDGTQKYFIIMPLV